MDRRTNRTDADALRMRIDLAESEAFLPPSRQALLDLGCAAIEHGMILVTGDAGVGKTWTVDRLTHRLRTCRWATVDLTPGDGPAEFYAHIARSLGLAGLGSARPTRLDILETIAERGEDGERFGLVIDEAQNLSAGVWEEVRVLANRLGRGDGFAHLILVGQTSLARRFATRALAAVEARLAGHLHVRPLDLAETNAWLASRHPAVRFAADELEAIHRDARGNPGRILRRSAAISARPHAPLAAALDSSRPPARPASLDSDLDESARPAMIAPRPSAPTSPRPPLHVDENAIEVGWSTDEAAPAAGAVDRADDEPLDAVPAAAEPSDQAVHDHYAALQAWREWASNQEKRNPPSRTDRDLADEIDEAAAAEAADIPGSTYAERSQVRVEGQQPFAPFGQLFARLNAPRVESPLP